VTAPGASAGSIDARGPFARPAGCCRGGERERIMAQSDIGNEGPEKIGKTISTILIACLVAFFLYGYIPHFFG
jgi:hypothetical protein